MKTQGARHRVRRTRLQEQLQQYGFLSVVLLGVFGGLTLMALLKGAVPLPRATGFIHAMVTPPAIVAQAPTPTVIALPKLAADTNYVPRGRLAGKHDGERTRDRLGALRPNSSSSPRGASEHAKSGDARKPHHNESRPARGRHRAQEHHHSHHTAPHRGGHHHASR